MIKIPNDYVALPRATYDLLMYANYDYNRMFSEIRKLVDEEAKDYVGRTDFKGSVSCLELIRILDIELEGLNE